MRDARANTSRLAALYFLCPACQPCCSRMKTRSRTSAGRRFVATPAVQHVATERQESPTPGPWRGGSAGRSTGSASGLISRLAGHLRVGAQRSAPSPAGASVPIANQVRALSASGKASSTFHRPEVGAQLPSTLRSPAWPFTLLMRSTARRHPARAEQPGYAAGKFVKIEPLIRFSPPPRSPTPGGGGKLSSDPGEPTGNVRAHLRYPFGITAFSHANAGLEPQPLRREPAGDQRSLRDCHSPPSYVKATLLPSRNDVPPHAITWRLKRSWLATSSQLKLCGSAFRSLVEYSMARTKLPSQRVLRGH